MTKPLRVLLVEDEPDDAELIVRELRRGGYEPSWIRVETAAELAEALRQTWDVVLSDYTLPGFGAPAALALVKEMNVDVPFIIVSGTIGDDTAVEAMRAGAHDYMVKGKLARLLPAIEREMREAAGRHERARMHEQLLFADRMASVGTLAAGVAHEINNPLAAVVANVDVVITDLVALREEISGHAQETDSGGAAEVSWEHGLASRLRRIIGPLMDVRESADRMRVIVRDLKVFSRADEERRGPVEVERVIESSLRMAATEIRHRARLTRDYRPVPPVDANKARLGQVFLNLLINAAQAIPEGDVDANEIRVSTRSDGSGRVLVEVRDTGIGIPAEMVARIFDPFVTTKPAGVGTGLGLAICRRIVTALGGEIGVESAEGVGTTFRVWLPASTSEAVAEAPPPESRPLPRRGRILLVDDDEILAVAIERMLETEHDVTLVTNARDARQRIAGGERFDVILCDLMMPQVTGMDLHADLAASVPDQAARMVFMTGGAFTPRARKFLDTVPNPRLDKPFDMARIRGLVRGLIQ